MSASVSSIPGGQPSTTQPIAGPWLSPKVVTRKRWPNVLCDIAAFRLPRFGLSVQIGRESRVQARHFGACDPEDHALGFVQAAHGAPIQPGQQPSQNAGGGAMAYGDCVRLELPQPVGNPGGHLGVILATRYPHMPFV